MLNKDAGSIFTAVNANFSIISLIQLCVYLYLEVSGAHLVYGLLTRHRADRTSGVEMTWLLFKYFITKKTDVIQKADYTNRGCFTHTNSTIVQAYKQLASFYIKIQR